MIFKKNDRQGLGPRKKAFKALMYNIALMDEAVARYLAVLSQPEHRNSIEAATALSKTYQKVRFGVGVVNMDALPGEVADKGVLLGNIFNEVSLLCKAADLSNLLGCGDFGAGFENLTAIYMPGANMFQPKAAVFSLEQLAEINNGIEHYNEVKAEFDDLIKYYTRKL